ncbi:porin [Pseudoduganella sp. LjRoot289]|uniref:porin n=1 Tax=Pseudoduganella sp. LjRoot289 TaxID=3342314 RepID=UPI003ECFE697
MQCSARFYRNAAALLAVCASSHAQHSVAPFGTLDVTFESVRAGPPASALRVSSNSSGFGVRGSEQLGGGMQAFYQIEGGYSVDTGIGGLNTRDTFAGLSGPLGSVRAGFMSTPLRALGGRLNFVPGGTSIANNMGVMSTLNGLHAGLNARLPNSVQYTAPPVAGVAATLLYAPGEARPGGLNDYSTGAGLAYDSAPWYAGWAYENRHAQQKQSLGNSSDWENRAVLRYTQGALALNLGWDRLGSRGLYGGAHGAVARDAWTVGAMLRHGPHDAMLHYTRAGRLKCSGAADSGQCAPALVGATGARQLSLLYHYTFSRRTMLIAFYSRISNGAQGRYDYDANPVVAALGSRAPGADPTGVGWGLRHSY